ncbi:IclR family transcriptional regulator [Marinactinospora thermotolerans]|uniref:Glycerol operon regulatory protein n=1 Tax=Marinactinospora thermotolerans DSM 45154 TaxID=1122192 RepID=A0A1T4S1Y7_9ACTN|nr:IclR family transcriptional regulator [Marinactinospora thermotolerans]SKA22320.1 transcriptional regulator, IclR family [Marinactinospora thermotolerans DSM 45154]
MSHVPSATRALRVLRFLAARPGPVTAGAVARALELPRSSAYQLLQAMAAEGFVTHLPEERRWGLGVAAFEVGSAYLRHDPLERLARPLLARLPQETGATAHLGVLHGRDTLYLLKERPAHAPALITGVGVRLPAHLTASGRALLAHLPRAQVRALYPDTARFVSRTGLGPGSPGELRDTLALERRRGWSAEEGQVTEGFRSVAAAAFDHNGTPVAAISLTVPQARPVTDTALAGRVRDAAAELTRRLGGRTPTPPVEGPRENDDAPTRT